MRHLGENVFFFSASSSHDSSRRARAHTHAPTHAHSASSLYWLERHTTSPATVMQMRLMNALPRWFHLGVCMPLSHIERIHHASHCIHIYWLGKKRICTKKKKKEPYATFLYSKHWDIYIHKFNWRARTHTQHIDIYKLFTTYDGVFFSTADVTEWYVSSS